MELPEFGIFEVEYFLEDDVIRECWSVRGVDHRIGKPAIIYYSAETREELKRIYKANGMVHRDQGPTIEEIEPTTGVVYREQHIRFDELERADGPAVIIRDRISGEVLDTQFYRFGEPVAPFDPPEPS